MVLEKERVKFVVFLSVCLSIWSSNAFFIWILWFNMSLDCCKLSFNCLVLTMNRELILYVTNIVLVLLTMLHSLGSFGRVRCLQ